MPRLFNFQGSDAEYIQYLECQVLEAQRLSGSFAPRHSEHSDQGPGPLSTNAAPIHSSSGSHQVRHITSTRNASKFRGGEKNWTLLFCPFHAVTVGRRPDARPVSTRPSRTNWRSVSCLGKRSRAGWRLPGHRSLTFYPFVQQMIGNWSLGDVGMDSGCWSA
jgi:hypothetical protein